MLYSQPFSENASAVHGLGTGCYHGGGKIHRTTRHSRFVAALLGLRHILPPLRYGKTSAMPGTLCNISGWAEIGPARNKKNKFVINYFEEKYY